MTLSMGLTPGMFKTGRPGTVYLIVPLEWVA